jgi:FkbM family methyltransferase
VRIIFHDRSIAPLMSRTSVLRNAGNKLYEYAFPIYRPLYATYKAYTDRAERQLLREVLFPGAVAVDAGANIGIYSRFLARRVGPAGVVHSFEPAPENFKRLRTAMCRFSNVHVYQVAVGERTSQAELYLSGKLNVDHRTYSTNESTRRMVPIDMIALDDHFKPGQRVDLIKIDIQGYELEALRGAKRILQEGSKISLLLELWPFGLKQAGADWGTLIDMLRGFDMDLQIAGSHGVRPFNPNDIRMDPSWYVSLFGSKRIHETRFD